MGCSPSCSLHPWVLGALCPCRRTLLSVAWAVRWGPRSSEPPLPTPVFPDTKPYEAAEPFGAPPGKVGAAGLGAPWEKGKSSEVSVMLTVSAAAAKVSEGTRPARYRGQRRCPRAVTARAADPSRPSSIQNLNGVMLAMAELLSVKIPSSYEVLFPDGPMRAAVVEAKKVEVDVAGERPPCPSSPRVPCPQAGHPVSPCWTPRDRLSVTGMLGGKEKVALAGKVPESSSEWLKQFDAVLPGYSLKGELDLLTLLRQVSGAWGPLGGALRP